MTRMVSRLTAQHVIEVGVDTGLPLAQYPAAARITGVDVSRDKPDTARRPVRPADAEALDFADASFDCVTLLYMLSVTSDPERRVAEVRFVCGPGGHVVIVNHFSCQRQWRYFMALMHRLAVRLGLRTVFSLEQHVLRRPWQVLSVAPFNLLSLSRLIHVRNV